MPIDDFVWFIEDERRVGQSQGFESSDDRMDGIIEEMFRYPYCKLLVTPGRLCREFRERERERERES